ncbi:MAG: hypothetical protein BAJALOKI1v1_2080007 [Promethearchaeota archaeon]|nr:MAG: hypothetical protein BAJALOKI1v1_2080007 [Candidatus Lokiarchaeota archaeon]
MNGGDEFRRASPWFMLWVRLSALYITKVTDPLLLNISHTIH